MIASKALFAAGIAAALAWTPAVAHDRTAQPVAAAAAQHHHGHGVWKSAGMTKPLKKMWRHEMRASLKSMPKAERRGWLRKQWLTMTDSQRHAKVAELQAKWNALPPSVQQTLMERKHRHDMRGAHRGGGEAGLPAPGTAPQ